MRDGERRSPGAQAVLPPLTVTRRQAMLTAGAALPPRHCPLPRRRRYPHRQSGLLAAGKFLTARELAILDEIAELIIPADAQSGGARAAKCAAYHRRPPGREHRSAVAAELEGRHRRDR